MEKHSRNMGAEDTSPSNETDLSIAPGSENANGDGKKSMEMKESVQEEPNTSEHRAENTSEARTGTIIETFTGEKFYLLRTGNTLKAHEKVVALLKDRIPGLQEVERATQSDFILAFCPVVSRAGTDIEAAVKKLQDTADNKPAVLVVLHHTFNPECVVPDSSRAVKRKNSITVDCLFHEDQGFLQCRKNDESLARIINTISPQAACASWPVPGLELTYALGSFALGSYALGSYALSSARSWFFPAGSSEGKQLEEGVKKDKDPKTSEGNVGGTSISDSSQLRLMLVGRTGSGKSAARCTILGREQSNQDVSSKSTQQSEKAEGKAAGKEVMVVDTPDWFSPELSLEKLREDVGQSVHLSDPGPHAFLLVIPVMQPRGEERGMLEKMEDIFGEGCWETALILFTVSEEDQKKNIQSIHSGNHEIQKLIEKCKNRFHCLNTTETGDDSQVSELLEKIEQMVEGNSKKFFSSEIYLKTLDYFGKIEKRISEIPATVFMGNAKEQKTKRKPVQEEAEERAQSTKAEQNVKKLKDNSELGVDEEERNKMAFALHEIWKDILTSTMKMQEDLMESKNQLKEKDRQIENMNEQLHEKEKHIRNIETGNRSADEDFAFL